MNDERSLDGFAHILVKEAEEIMRTAKTEEDLRIGFEKALDPIKKRLGLSSGTYERRPGTSEYKGRTDAMHGKVIIEYEPPGCFSRQSAMDHAADQLRDYLSEEGYVKGEAAVTLFERPLGVGFDGERIFFVRFKDDANAKDGADAFVVEGPYFFDAESARTFLMHLRGLSRKPLTPENLAEVFGPKSALASQVVNTLANAFEHWDQQPRVRVFFNEWKRLFGIVYGEHFDASKKEEAEALSTYYRVGKETDFQELLFSVHTYFAYLMKLIALEILTLRDPTAAIEETYALRLTHADREKFKKELEDMESGGQYARRGISNFLEGDFFRWYLDAFSPALEDSLREVARKLSEFEPATTAIHPQAAKDLLKKLYQYLVPQLIRHKLGEYYTPDWLAELVIDETGYNGNLEKRFLDPSCGSGTFLVLAIQRAKAWAKEKKVPTREALRLIRENIYGFDLNPLAVIASRTNYIFALGDLVTTDAHLELPVYLADSVLSPLETGDKDKGLFSVYGDFYSMQTSVGEFRIPAIWIQLKGLQMERASAVVEELVKRQEDVPSAMKRLAQDGLVTKGHEQVVERFYEELLDLEKKGKNGIWARFLKNAFAPTLAGQFDFVIGNPPWIRWGILSKEYREATLHLWKDYGLFSLTGHAARLGGGEKDFSMLFTYAALDRFVKKGGRLGFLITQELFKSKGAGEGFRRFCIGGREKFQVWKAHDLVTVQPFEGAANKTAAIFLKRGNETQYPVPYTLWSRKKGVGRIPTDTPYDFAMKMLTKQKLLAQPMGNSVGSWQTLAADNLGAASVAGKNCYKAYLGIRAVPYGVFWLHLKSLRSDGNLLVDNLPEKGKTKIDKIEVIIENDLVYPAIRGKDIQRWHATPGIYLLLTQDEQKREPYPESTMKERWPRTYDYLARMKHAFEVQASKAVRALASRTAFYAVLGVGEYTLSNYKVMWKGMASDLVAAVVSEAKTPFGWKKVISTHTTSLIPSNNEDEAHFICAVLNSLAVRDFVKSYSSAGRGFGTPSVMQHIGIPKFDPKNELHAKLSRLSKDLHELISNGKQDETEQKEKEVNNLVVLLFS